MSSKRVLIFEDELLVAKMYTLILEKNDFETKVVSVVNDIENVILNFSPDVIVMDNQLKNKESGFEASLMIREKGINIPIVFTTGNSETLAKEFITKVNNSNYMIKPIDAFDLLNAINLIIK